MQLSHTSATLILASALALITSSAPSGAPLTPSKSIKLSGCLIRGEGDGAGYLLISHAFDPAATASTGAPVTPGRIGTTGDFANIFYWLDGSGDLRKHIGHRVEIEGDAKGDVKDAEMKINRKENWTELTVKSDGRTMNARVPPASIVAGADADRKMDVLVRKIDVERVRMLAADCQ